MSHRIPLHWIMVLFSLMIWTETQRYTGTHGLSIILSSGLGGWDKTQLQNQYNAFSSYSKMGIVTDSSILVYNLDENGNLDTYNTSDPGMTAEEYQASMKNLNLKTYPCLFCDATIGNCNNLGDRLKKLYTHQQEFIDSTIDRGYEYGWDGYTVDFEPDQPIDPERLTEFIVDWGQQLHDNSMTLFVWVGGSTAYNMSTLYSEPLIKIITMGTYTGIYDNFIQIASESLTMIGDPQRLGLGLLTSDMLKKDPMHLMIRNGSGFGSGIETLNKGSHFNIINFSQETVREMGRWSSIGGIGYLSIWASIIPPTWYMGLNIYINCQKP